MASFIRETGRHGLRCKHFVDKVIHRAAELGEKEMSIEEIFVTATGLIRFVRDWQIFFHKTVGKLRANLLKLDLSHLFTCLRFSRDLRANG
eukprot:g3752.t1